MQHKVQVQSTRFQKSLEKFFRAADVERWRKQLEKTLAEVNAEISVLHDAKEACERALEAKAVPHDVTTECI